MLCERLFGITEQAIVAAALRRNLPSLVTAPDGVAEMNEKGRALAKLCGQQKRMKAVAPASSDGLR